MVDYPFKSMPVADPHSFARAANAEVTIYAATDTANATPLAIKDPSGIPLPNPMVTTPLAYLQPFLAPVPDIKFVGGGLEVFESSPEGLRNEAVDASAAAQAAADDAAMAAGNTVASAAVDGAGKLIITKQSGATVDAGSVIGPVGPKGDKGADGSNVLPTDTAIRDAVVTPGTLTRTAIEGEFATKRAVRVGTRKRLNAAPVKHMVPANAAGHGWALQSDVSNNASSNLNDTSDFLIGSQAMRITTAGTAAYVGWDKTLTAPIDVSDCDVRIWFKFDAAGANLNNIQLILGDSALTWRSTLTPFSAGTATSYTQWPLQAGRWNILDIPQGAGWTATGTPNWAALQRILLKVSDKSGAPLTARLGGVAFTKRDHAGRFPNGVATLTFDDSFAAQDSYARVKMDQYGYKGTLFPIIDRIGLPGKVTMAQIQGMYQNGWDIAGHAYTDANHSLGLPGLTQEQRRTELENIKAWMDANAFQTQAFAYPLGNHDAASEADVATYFDCGRLAFMQRDTPQAIAQPFAMQAVNAGTQTAALAGYITRAVAGKGWVNIVIHDIVPSGATGNNMTQAAFDTLLADLAASGIAVRTMSEVLAANN